MQKSQLVTNAEKTHRTALDRLAAIDAAERKAHQRHQEAQERLSRLKGELSALLARQALGEDVTERVERVRAELEAARREVEDTPLVLKGLDALRPALNRQRNQAQHVLSRLSRYEQNKAALRENWSDLTERALFDLAESLDMTEDAEEFISGLLDSPEAPNEAA